jgi:DHA1 family multidrug resistance protein-like MFS transporter
MPAVFVSTSNGVVSHELVIQLLERGCKILGLVGCATEGEALERELNSSNFSFEIVESLHKSKVCSEVLKRQEKMRFLADSLEKYSILPVTMKLGTLEYTSSLSSSRSGTSHNGQEDEDLSVIEKEYPFPMEDRSIYAVSYNGQDDPAHPFNWPSSKKLLICFVAALAAFSISLGSAMFSEGGQQVQEEYHVGDTVSTLGTSLFVFGFASGPVIWGPLSELFGRRMVMIPSCLGYALFTFAVASAQDIQTIMICRFFAGFIGGAPFVIGPAVLVDMFRAEKRGIAMSIFGIVVFGGPMIAPILGAFIAKNPHLGWRWTSYITGFVAALANILVVLLLDETHHPIILVHKAAKLRAMTGNWAIYAPHEEFTLTLRDIVEKNITRPIHMLFTEPILFLVTLYNAFIYGILYLMLTAMPLIFEGRYHFRAGVGELPYVSMFLGVLVGAIISLFFEMRFKRIMKANNGATIPEERLPPMMAGSFFFAIGLFWLGWTGDYPDKIHWMVPTVGSSFIGCGFLLIFLPCLNYIIDCYLVFAASALAGNTLLRSAFGAAFPLFARPMFVNMHIKWASTLLGAFAVLMIPVPFGFYKYGKRARGKSKFTFP